MEVMEPPVQYKKTLDSIYNVPFQEARIVDVPKDMDLCAFMQGGVESSYRRYVRNGK